MTIGTDDGIDKFGTQDTVTAGGGTSAVSSGAFSASGDTTTWTNDDDAPMASAVFQGDFASAPTAGETVDIYLRLMDIDSTNDAPQPDSNFKMTFAGTLIVDADAAAQYVAIDIPLPNTTSSQDYQFYIQNNTSVSLDSGWTLKITPKTFGPHA